jgi:hypothetical protein
LAVLTTNYQGSGGEASHIVSLQVDRLPPRLAHRRLQLERYLIDSTRSNYARLRISGGPAHAHGTIDAQRPSDPQCGPCSCRFRMSDRQLSAVPCAAQTLG